MHISHVVETSIAHAQQYAGIVQKNAVHVEDMISLFVETMLFLCHGNGTRLVH